MPTRRRRCWRTTTIQAGDRQHTGEGVAWRPADPAAITSGNSPSTPCGASPSPPTMNTYGHIAISHWQTFLPDRLRAIPESDRTRFFTELGEQAAAEIEELQMQLAGPDPVGEGYLEKVGRLNAARMQAEEKVLAELILLAPEERTRTTRCRRRTASCSRIYAGFGTRTTSSVLARGGRTARPER